MAELCDEWASRGKTNLWGVIPEIAEMQSEGGSAGGKLIAEGTPEQIAETPDSYTGQCLRQIM